MLANRRGAFGQLDPAAGAGRDPDAARAGIRLLVQQLRGGDLFALVLKQFEGGVVFEHLAEHRQPVTQRDCTPIDQGAGGVFVRGPLQDVQADGAPGQRLERNHQWPWFFRPAQTNGDFVFGLCRPVHLHLDGRAGSLLGWTAGPNDQPLVPGCDGHRSPEDKRRLAELHAKLAGSEVIKALLKAQADYVELMTAVSQRIEQETMGSTAAQDK